MCGTIKEILYVYTWGGIHLFEVINKKKEQLDAAHPLPKYTLKSLRKKLFLEWTYNSNAIEGNTLTMNEMGQINGVMTNENTKNHLIIFLYLHLFCSLRFISCKANGPFSYI